MQVYERVREYIEANHIKQKSVAEAASIPNVTFNAMLNGKRKMYAEDLRAICFALNVSADIFFGLNSTYSVAPLNWKNRRFIPKGKSHTEVYGKM